MPGHRGNQWRQITAIAYTRVSSLNERMHTARLLEEYRRHRPRNNIRQRLLHCPLRLFWVKPCVNKLNGVMKLEYVPKTKSTAIREEKDRLSEFWVSWATSVGTLFSTVRLHWKINVYLFPKMFNWFLRKSLQSVYIELLFITSEDFGRVTPGVKARQVTTGRPRMSGYLLNLLSRHTRFVPSWVNWVRVVSFSFSFNSIWRWH